MTRLTDFIVGILIIFMIIVLGYVKAIHNDTKVIRAMLESNNIKYEEN